MTDLRERVSSIQSRESLAAFIGHLADDIRDAPDGWENSDLETYLQALSAYVADLDGYFLGLGSPVPDAPWWLFGAILLAARKYE